MSDEKRHLVRAGKAPSQTLSHPLNENSQIEIEMLSRIAGMQRIGVNRTKIPPGKESFIYHSHQTEEEFIYVISGRGKLAADDAETEIGPGDFIGFSTPSVAHLVRNPFKEDLICLMGGENKEAEVTDFPRAGKRGFRGPTSHEVVDYEHISNLQEGSPDS